LSLLGSHPTAMATTLCLTIRESRLSRPPVSQTDRTLSADGVDGARSSDYSRNWSAIFRLRYNVVSKGAHKETQGLGGV